MASTPPKSRFWGQNASILLPRRFAVHCRPPCPTYPQHGPSWLPLGAQHRARTAPKGTRKPFPGATFCYPVRSLIFDNPPMVFLYFSSPAGSQRAVCWHKKKFTLENSFCSRYRSMPLWMRFWPTLSQLGANLEPKMASNLPPEGVPRRGFWSLFLPLGTLLEPRCPQEAPGSPSDPPKPLFFHPFSIDFAA